MNEKRGEGLGEDSSPLSLIRKGDTNNFCAVGVFDGMGGSGATKCASSSCGENKTHAYVASRVVEKSVENYCNKVSSIEVINADFMHDAIKEALEKEKKEYPAQQQSSLKSRMIREYPTTLAVVVAPLTEEGKTIHSYWAGDSRNYLWNKRGFFQISEDDIEPKMDPLENLSQDGVLSNCICADKDFKINYKEILIEEEKFIILSATDGCFGYFLTPMHFQGILLEGLKSSKNEKEWEKSIQKEIQRVTGDDSSLSLIAIGYKDFEELKMDMECQKVVGFQKTQLVHNTIQILSEVIKDIVPEGWSEYKEKYLSKLKGEQDNTYSSNSNEVSIPEIEEEKKPHWLYNLFMKFSNLFSKHNDNEEEAKREERKERCYKLFEEYKNTPSLESMKKLIDFLCEEEGNTDLTIDNKNHLEGNKDA